MLPVVAGKRETKKQMLIYTLLLLPLSIAPAWLGIAGWIYGTVALALSLVFVAAAVAVWFDDSDRSAKRRFGYSILYLLVLFALLIAARVPGRAGAASDGRTVGKEGVSAGRYRGVQDTDNTQ